MTAGLAPPALNLACIQMEINCSALQHLHCCNCSGGRKEMSLGVTDLERICCASPMCPSPLSRRGRRCSASCAACAASSPHLTCWLSHSRYAGHWVKVVFMHSPLPSPFLRSSGKTEDSQGLSSCALAFPRKEISSGTVVTKPASKNATLHFPGATPSS